MTVIAYRDGTIAADRLVTAGQIVYRAKKIIKHDDMLIGAAGDANACIKLIDWITGKRKKPRFTPDMWEDESDGVDMIVAYKDGRVHRFSNSTEFDVVAEDYIAIGYGAGPALGCMWKGGTAEEAVKAAIQHSSGCGGPIDILKFED